MSKKFSDFLKEEVGFRNLKEIPKKYKTFELWLHKDLDGVCSALSMKHFLTTHYGLKLIDCHIIQYGSLEFATNSANKSPDNLPIIVDFAHGKVGYMLFDHHDNQIGGEESKGVYAKASRSNAEIISGEISYSDAFTAGDIELIKTIDSADFVKHNLKPEDIQNSIFSYNKELSSDKNRFMMGVVVNRLLLAYKNKRITVTSLDGKREHKKKNILECLSLDSSPSLYSMYSNIKHYVNNAKVSDKLGVLAKPEDLMANISEYIDKMKNYRFIETEEGEVEQYDPQNWRHQKATKNGIKHIKGVHFDEKYKIIMQYGGGSMFKAGSYDRYVSFKNNPEANFNCIIWPMGLIQVSCNPFKEKKLKDINLGEISKEVLAPYEDKLRNIYITLDGVKRELESSQDFKKMLKDEPEGTYEPVGFKYPDLKSFYKDCIYRKDGNKYVKVDNIDSYDIGTSFDIHYHYMDGDVRRKLEKFAIPVWDLIVRNSGGHPSITNIQGFNFLKYDSKKMKESFEVEKYTDVMKKIAREFVDNLKSKIDELESGSEVSYTKTDFELLGQETNENLISPETISPINSVKNTDYEYFLANPSGAIDKVSQEEFVKAGSRKGMRPDMKSGLTVDQKNRRIIAKFESFKKYLDGLENI